MNFFELILLFLVSFTARSQGTLPHIISHHPLQCNWQKIDVHKVTFPKNFGWGAAMSAFQAEGTVTAQDKHVENIWTKAMDEGKAKPIGKGCDHWNRYKEDIQLIKQLGLNEYRFSIKWSAVMPKENEFDKDAMNHYIDLTSKLINNGITPYIMLFHHAWPLWFDEKKAFEKEKNINDFVKFSMYVFESLQKKLSSKEFKRIKWMTFNEPVGYSMEGYFRGHYPPYKKDLKLAGIVLKNMLDAHVEVYHAFKKIDSDAQIGFSHMVVPIDPHRFYHPIDALTSKLFDDLHNYTFLSYFTHGKFTWGFPGYGHLPIKNEKAIGALDFLAVNYYFNVMLRFQCFNPKMVVETLQGRPLWGTNKCIYPEGLYRAVANVAHYLPKVPLIIGENGIATDDPVLRKQYIKTHLYVVHQLIKDGYDVRAYHWWALMDTYSWSSGEFSPYGFYAFDPITYERTLRKDKGFEDFLHLIKHNSYPAK